ncbi:flavin reductase family protein [Pseudonocardia sp. GCM10023141]|uniref:flavin reductase family protein n=1 Tax=Pseudonocardia sp. GCM10023141 TaxID=3252653 RepID=UPI00360B55E8
MTATVGLAGPDTGALRDALGRFATGVTVITTVDGGGEPVGCTVSAFCALSLEPPLVLVCIGRGRRMHETLTTAPGFAVNVLGADQRAVATAFARSTGDRFAAVTSTPGRHDSPLLDGTIARFECDRESVLDGGDHAVVVGRVRALATSDGEPLLYVRGAFLDVARPAWDRAVADAAPEWLLSAPW